MDNQSLEERLQSLTSELKEQRESQRRWLVTFTCAAIIALVVIVVFSLTLTSGYFGPGAREAGDVAALQRNYLQIVVPAVLLAALFLAFLLGVNRKKNLDSRVDEVTDRLWEEFENYKSGESAALEEKLSSGIGEISEEYAKRLSNTAETNRTEIETLTSAAKTEYTAMTSGAKTEYEALTFGMQADLSDLAENSKKELEELSNGARMDLSDLADVSKKDLSDLAGSSKQGLEDMSRLARMEIGYLANSVKTEFQDLAGQSRTDLQNLAEGWRTELTDLADTSRSSLEALAGSRKTEFTDLADSRRAELTDLADSRRAELTDLSDSRRTELTELADGRKAELTELADSRRTEYTDLADCRKAELTELADSRRAEYTDLADGRKAELTELADGRRAELTELADGRKAELTEIADASRSSLEALAGSARTALTDLADGRKAELEGLSAKSMEEIQTEKSALLGLIEEQYEQIGDRARAAEELIVQFNREYGWLKNEGGTIDPESVAVRRVEDAHRLIDEIFERQDLTKGQQLSEVQVFVRRLASEPPLVGGAEAYHGLAEDLVVRGRKELAIQVSDRGLALFPESAALLADRLFCGEEIGEESAALQEYFDRLMETDRKTWNGSCFSLVENRLMADGELAKAEEACLDHKAFLPREEWGYANLAAVYGRMYQGVEAEDKKIAVLREAVDMGFACPRCAGWLADLYADRGELEEAVRCSGIALLSLAKEEPVGHYANVLFRRGMFQDRLFLRGIIDKNSADPSLAARAMEDYAKAIRTGRLRQSTINQAKERYNLLAGYIGAAEYQEEAPVDELLEAIRAGEQEAASQEPVSQEEAAE